MNPTIKAIFYDFWLGLIDSLRIDLIMKVLFRDVKFQKLIWKILKFNMWILIPWLIFYFSNMLDINFDFVPGISGYFSMYFVDFWRYVVYFSRYFIYFITTYILGILDSLFHILHYIDLINIISNHSPRSTVKGRAIGALTFTIIMTIYQLIIFLTTSVINFIFYDRIYLLAVVLNLGILTIYHSLYCFNNLWHYKNLELYQRIDIHEKLWPYHCGFGLVASIIYLVIQNPLITMIYNLYLTVLLSLPFLIETRYPPSNPDNAPYPAINLTIFGYCTRTIVHVGKYLLKTLIF